MKYEVEIIEELSDAMEGRLLQLAYDYCKETGYNWTFSFRNALRTIRAAVYNHGSDFFALCHEGVPVGFCILTTEANFATDVNANIYMFYVKPEHRGYKGAQILMSKAVERAKSLGALYLFSSSLSRIDDRCTQAYNKMLERRGFERISPTYVKEFNHE